MNNLSANIKLSKTQLSNAVYLGEFIPYFEMLSLFKLEKPFIGEIAKKLDYPKSGKISWKAF